jgi:hypothetical protein
MKYLRIGTRYHKKVVEPMHSGDKLEKLISWSRSELELDHGKEFLKKIPKYDGFCLIPSHDNYKEVIDSFYNEYEKLSHKKAEGSYDKTEMFLKHIFEEHYILAFDYLTILWRYPSQTLPVLALVSKEKGTGKTTFLNWMKLIFEKNMTINSNADFDSRFNSDWANKLIIAIDEVMLNGRHHTEKLKQLATAKSIKSEAKGKDKNEKMYFGKLILNANDEEGFIKTDDQEMRFWVRKVKPLSISDNVVKSKGNSIRNNYGNPNMLEELKQELTAFTYFLSARKIVNPKVTRMWFTKEQLHTKALEVLIKGSRSTLYEEIHFVITELFEMHEVYELHYSAKDIVDILIYNGYREVTSSRVSEILRKEFELKARNSSYRKYHYISVVDQAFTSTEKSKGRFFTFARADYIVDVLTINKNPILTCINPSTDIQQMDDTG